MSRLPPALLLIATMSAAHVDEVVIYRCVDAAGALAIQNMPCPPGTRQSRRVMQAPQPAVVPMPPAPLQAQAAPLPSHVPGPVRPTPTPEPGPPPVPAPPPPLFQCSSRDGGQYLQEDPEPVPRCVPLRTVGLDGNPRTGAGEACEVVRDRCQPVAAEALCDSWKQRLAEAGMRWRLAGSRAGDADGAEFQRLQSVVQASECPR